MKPEGTTGINAQGWRVHCEGCTCDYNEVSRRELVPDTSPLEITVITDRIISRVDAGCVVHRG
ncbi:hypothetical protein PP634_gp41 [Arthrobacter phage Richie]|uniref:Uncharacterized protein n=1 Tax=Arthrobacter phage Richie TaxID=2419967 RepID=A0A3G2KIS4_9CAUD|nr:hypothetical protein PP634_gp41 [Arthrobacter phage Richie]AYN58867.1 hypothetical protein PBI_RICHIE_41 [Arthrobacter phage Richie]